MTTRRRVLAGAAAGTAMLPISAFAKLFRGGGVASGAAPEVLATLAVNNVDTSSMPATAFWELGQPFADGDVPSGSIVTATFDGTSVPLQAIARSTYASGALKWGLFHADLSGIALSAGAAKNLVLSSAVGSWSSTTGRTDADWAALVDTVELTNLTTTGTSTAVMDKAGTWIAAFDDGATNTVEVIGTSPLGLRVRVLANFVNTGTTHRFLRAYMEYWVTQLAGGGLGPIASFGPMLENTRMLLTNPSQFTFDVNFKRGGASQRTMTGVPCIAGTLMPFCRADAQFEWTANEPVVVITRSIAELRGTKKIPPYVSTLTTYAFATEAAITGIAGAVFTIADVAVLWPTTTFPIAVGFRTTGTIWGGGSVATTYWATRVNGTTFSIYDTRANAVAGGSTGKITPSSAGSGNFVRHDAAPASPGPICQGFQNAGNRPDISLTTEWATARVFADGVSVAAAQSAQRLARAVACAMSGIPYHYLDDTTGKIISLLPTPETPAGMQGAADYSAAYFTGSSYSSQFGGGSGPTGGQNNWDTNTTYSNSAHMPAPVYLTWLLEGKAYFRDLLFFLGNRGLAALSYGPQQTYDDAAVGGGATFYRNWILSSGIDVRSPAWAMRDVSNALVAAADGSDEQDYFAQTLKDNTDLAVAFRNYKGTEYKNLGMLFYDSGDWPASTHNLAPAVVETFMMVYFQNAIEFVMMQHSDNTTFNTNLQVIADAISAWAVAMYSLLGFDATVYTINPRVTKMGQATTGATYASALSGCGQGPGSSMRFAYATNGTITWSGADPWWTLVVGDKFQPTNYLSLDTASGSTPTTADPPAELTAGTLYTILTVNVGAKTFTLDNGSGGTQTFATNPSSVAGWFYPAAALAGMASTGFISDANGSPGPDGFGAHVISGLAMAALRGVTGASAAFTSANNRYALGTPLDYDEFAMWYMQPTL